MQREGWKAITDKERQGWQEIEVLQRRIEGAQKDHEELVNYRQAVLERDMQVATLQEEMTRLRDTPRPVAPVVPDNRLAECPTLSENATRTINQERAVLAQQRE